MAHRKRLAEIEREPVYWGWTITSGLTERGTYRAVLTRDGFIRYSAYGATRDAAVLVVRDKVVAGPTLGPRYVDRMAPR